MGRTMNQKSDILNQEQYEGLKTILEFYREFGFERLPLNCSSKFSSKEKEHFTNCSLITNKDSLNPLTPLDDTHCPSLNKEALLKALQDELRDCRKCKLSERRTNIVFGEGNLNARIMFIGEAPGSEEDRQARPFVGDAGMVLNRLIEKMGFKRQDVYIANIVKCRPPMNRDPHGDEIASCFQFLSRQIEIISPDVIMSLGKISSHTLLMVDVPLNNFFISKIRGRFYDYKGIPVMPTFHPAYLLRNSNDKWLTWDDALAVLEKLGVKK